MFFMSIGSCSEIESVNDIVMFDIPYIYIKKSRHFAYINYKMHAPE